MTTRTLFAVAWCAALCACSSSNTDATTDTGATTDSGATADGAATDTGAATDSGSTSDSPATTDTGGATDVAAETSGDLCSMIPANTAAEITDSVDTTPYPGASATGGAIESGTYEQTGHVYYQPTSTPTHKWKGTMVIDAAAKTAISNISRDGSVFQQLGDTYTTSGSTFAIKIVCPSTLAGTMASFTYTYAAGKLTIFADADKTATIFQKK